VCPDIPHGMKQILFLMICGLLLVSEAQCAENTAAQTTEAFLNGAFLDACPEPDYIWITKSLQPEVKKILNHDYQGIRIKYWKLQKQTAWVLSEIVKNKRITVGIAIKQSKIENVKILFNPDHRSRQMTYSSFTDQFKGIASDDQYGLTKNIDAISGATMSSVAVAKLAQLALFLDHHVDQKMRDDN